jgi:hypothetical protein
MLPDSILKSINQKIHVGGIFCDFVKASDCVNHEIFLVKLHYVITAFEEQQPTGSDPI